MSQPPDAVPSPEAGEPPALPTAQSGEPPALPISQAGEPPALPTASADQPTTRPAGRLTPSSLEIAGYPVPSAAEVRVKAKHIAARIEDEIQLTRQGWRRRRGHIPTVIPYTGYGAKGWIRVLCRVVYAKPETDPSKQFEGMRGWRSFFSVPVTGEQVLVTAGDRTVELQIDRGGVVDARVEVELPPGVHSIELRTSQSEPVVSEVYVVDPAERFGVISDVDDTIMVTALPRPLLAAWNTFVLDEHARRPVTGMPVLYDRIRRRHTDAPVVYLSTGAWNVAPTLSRFLARNLYPGGPLLLTDWGPTHDRFFRSGLQHKRDQLRRLAEEFPEVRWLLFGDDGQHDEEIYGEFAREYPRSVAAVAIRQLSAGEAVLAGGRSKAAARESESPVRWFFGPDGASLWDQLTSAGIIGPR